MIFLTFLTALALSAVAGYYSVIGLAAIFPGSFWPIIIMGSTLEGAKLVTVSWLYRNWKVAHLGMKWYLAVATVILMIITSMGIFGYLSKAHLEHSADTAPLVAKVQLLDEKIRVAKDNLDANRKILRQLDEQVDQTMGRSSDEKGIANSVSIRRSQQKERLRIATENETYQKTIAELTETRFPIQNEVAKAESDFGPIKYVAELIYGSGERDIIDKAVRLVIMLIMVVFDPLAVLLLIAANISMMDKRKMQYRKQEPTPEAYVADVGEPPKEEQKQVEEEKTPVTKLTDELEIPVFGQKSPGVEIKTVEIPKDNLIVIDEAGTTIPPTTKYDYDEPFSFKQKKEMDGGKF